MAYTPQQRQRIILRAKRKVGKIKNGDADDKQEFMDSCISSLEDNGVDNAEDACAALWEEQEGSEGG